MEVLRIRRERGAARPGLQGEARETLDELSVEEVFQRRLGLEALEEAEAARLTDLYRQVLEQVRDDTA